MMSSQPTLTLRRRTRWCQSWRFSVTLETTWTLLTCWGPALSEVRGAALPPNLVHSLGHFHVRGVGLCWVWTLLPICICTFIIYLLACLFIDWICFMVIGTVWRGCVACADNIGLLLKIRYWTSSDMRTWCSLTARKFTAWSINIIYLSSPQHWL